MRVGNRIRCIKSAYKGVGLSGRMLLVTSGQLYTVSDVEDVGNGVVLVAVDGQGTPLWSAGCFEEVVMSQTSEDQPSASGSIDGKATVGYALMSTVDESFPVPHHCVWVWKTRDEAFFFAYDILEARGVCRQLRCGRYQLQSSDRAGGLQFSEHPSDDELFSSKESLMEAVQDNLSMTEYFHVFPVYATSAFPADANTQKDWRIGLRVTPKLRTDSLFSRVGEIVNVLPSGSFGVTDPNGVVVVRILNELVISPAERWMTA